MIPARKSPLGFSHTTNVHAVLRLRSSAGAIRVENASSWIREVETYFQCHKNPSRGIGILTGNGFIPRSVPPEYYLLSVKSAFVSPLTLTGLDWLFAPSCQAVTL